MTMSDGRLISILAAIDALEKEKPTPFVNEDGSIDPFGAGQQNQWYRDGLAIMNLPPAQQWIPVSERLPKNDDWVIVTILDERGDTPFKYTDFGWYLEEANCWVIGAEQRKDVTAWMPLPGPYKEDKNDADVC